MALAASYIDNGQNVIIMPLRILLSGKMSSLYQSCLDYTHIHTTGYQATQLFPFSQIEIAVLRADKQLVPACCLIGLNNRHGDLH
jgi:hypothetical protein